MKLKDIVFEDFINYKKPSMFLITTKCDFKCCKEQGNNICQNMSIINNIDVNVNNDKLIKQYLNNPITKAIVIGGLEPFDTFDELYEFIRCLRYDNNCLDDVVIYTGYVPAEIYDKTMQLAKFRNIYIKVGRFIPNQEPHFDAVLGINLASDNQWCFKLS